MFRLGDQHRVWWPMSSLIWVSSMICSKKNLFWWTQLADTVCHNGWATCTHFLRIWGSLGGLGVTLMMDFTNLTVNTCQVLRHHLLLRCMGTARVRIWTCLYWRRGARTMRSTYPSFDVDSSNPNLSAPINGYWVFVLEWQVCIVLYISYTYEDGKKSKRKHLCNVSFHPLRFKWTLYRF